MNITRESSFWEICGFFEERITHGLWFIIRASSYIFATFRFSLPRLNHMRMHPFSIDSVWNIISSWGKCVYFEEWHLWIMIKCIHTIIIIMIVIFSVQPEKGSPRIQVSKDVVYLGQDAEVGGLSSSQSFIRYLSGLYSLSPGSFLQW